LAANIKNFNPRENTRVVQPEMYLVLPSIFIAIIVYYCSRLSYLSILGSILTSVFISLLYFLIQYTHVIPVLGDSEYYLGTAIEIKSKINTGASIHEVKGLLFADGRHIIYFLYNILAFSLFGEGHYAPIALNTSLIAIMAVLFVKLVKPLGINSYNLQRIFYLYVLLNPELVGWAISHNLKDIFVLFLIVSALVCIIGLRSRPLISLIVLSVIITTLIFLRFYLIGIIFASVFVTFIFLGFPNKSRMSIYLFVIVSIALTLYFGVAIPILSQISDRLNFQNLVQLPYGIVKFLFTPIPFNATATEGYVFLNFTQFFYLSMTFFMFLGIIYSAKSNRFSTMLIFTFFVLVTVIFASSPAFHDVRHRIMLLPFISYFQFVGIRYYLAFLKSKTSPAVIRE
jgi:hypothetical protein